MRSEVRSNSRLFAQLCRSLLEQGIAVRFQASGRSMYPAIAHGDVVEVVPAPTHSQGDIVLVETDSGIRAHRIISADGATVLTKGDCCIDPDQPAAAASVFGRIAVVIRCKRRWSAHSFRTCTRQLFGRFSWLFARKTF